MISTELQAQINHLNCGALGLIGTGTNNCPFDFERLLVLILTVPGFQYEEALSNAYIQTLQMKGIAVVQTKSTAFEDLTAQDNQETDAGSNIITTAGKSPYTYKSTYRNGLYNHKALTSLEGFGKWDATYIDEKLNILFTASPTAAKGFTLGQLSADPYMMGNGQNKANTKIWWQELYRYEKDLDVAWIVAAKHDIRPATIDGINDVVIEFVVVPGDGDTTIKFTAKTKADMKDVDLGGLLAANLLLTGDGTPITISGTPTLVNGVYTASVAALDTDQELELSLYNATYASAASKGAIILKGGRLYASNKAAATVVA